MAKDAAAAGKAEKSAGKADKSAAKADKPAKADKKAEKKTEAAVEAAPAAPAKPVAEPRPPADPRLKVLKKFYGKFLPKGPLRQRFRDIMDRWNSGEDHGGVTVEELKALLADWKGTREKPPRIPKG